MTHTFLADQSQLTITACCGLTLTRPLASWVNPIQNAFGDVRPVVRMTTFEMLKHEPHMQHDEISNSVLLVIFPDSEPIQSMYHIAEHARQSGRPTMFLCESLDARKIAVADEGLLVEHWDMQAEQACQILQTLVRRQPAVTRLSRELDLAEQLLSQAPVAPQNDEELQLAGLIPQEVIPSNPPRLLGLDLAIAHRAAGGIPRDLVDITLIDEDVVRIFAADSLIDGTAGALLSIRMAKAVKALGGEDQLSRIFHPGIAMADLNDELAESDLGAPSRRAAAFYGVLELRTGELTFSLAGYPLPAIISEGSVQRLGNQTSPLGSKLGTEYPEYTTVLGDDDLLAIISDGAEEALHDKVGFKLPDLLDLPQNRSDHDLDNVARKLEHHFDSIPGSMHRQNDCTLVAMRLAVGHTMLRRTAA